MPLNFGLRLISPSKLPVGVNVSVNGCLSLCVSPVMNRGLVQHEPPQLAKCQQGSAPAPPPPPCN